MILLLFPSHDLRSEDVEEHNLLKEAVPFYSKISRPVYKTRTGENCLAVLF